MIRPVSVCCVVLGLTALAPSQAIPRFDWQAMPEWHARTDHAMAYDPVRQRVVMYGRRPGWTDVATWEFDGSEWTPVVTVKRPALRYAHGMAYDPISRRVLLMGGYTEFPSAELFADTWAWDGRDWENLTHAGGPPARLFPTMVTDWIRGNVLLFGGKGSTGSFSLALDDTWVWDGQRWGLQTLWSRPGRRGVALSAFDSQEGGVVVHGGYSGGFAYTDTWLWDGASWQDLQVPPPAFSALIYPFAGTDPLSGKLLIYGGRDTITYQVSADSYILSARTWVRQPLTQPHPGRRTAGAFAYTGNRLILVGGHDNTLNQKLSTWALDASGWHLLDDRPIPPIPSAMGHFGARDEVIICGEGGNVWTFKDGRMRPLPSPAPFHYANSVVYHAGLDRVFVAAEDTNYRTTGWLWDGQTWSPAPGGAPPITRRLGYNDRRQVILGADTYEQRVWEWHHQRGWTATPYTSASLPAREAVQAGYDPVRDRLVVFGGTNSQTGSIFDGTYEWDGSRWHEVPKTTSDPGPRCFGLMTYAPSLGGLIMAMGYGPGPPGRVHQDIWLYNGAWRRIAADGVLGPGRQRHRSLFWDPLRNRLFQGYYPAPETPSGLFWADAFALAVDVPRPRPGQQISLDAYLAHEAGQLLAVTLSTGLSPAIPLRTYQRGVFEVFPLAPSPLLAALMQTTTLDNLGFGRVSYRLPNDRSLGSIPLHAAGITVRPGGILGTITGSATIRVVP